MLAFLRRNAKWITIVAVESFWNDDKVAELKRLWVEENLSGSQIALALGLKDRNAVMGKIHRLGITRKIVAGEGEGAPRPGARRPRETASGVQSGPDVAQSVEQPPVQVAPPSPPEVPEPVVAHDAFADHPVMQLKERSCKWPIGDPQRKGFHFCCAERLGSFPYCEEHARISYQVPDRSPRRPAIPGRAKAA